MVDHSSLILTRRGLRAAAALRLANSAWEGWTTQKGANSVRPVDFASELGDFHAQKAMRVGHAAGPGHFGRFRTRRMRPTRTGGISL